MKFDDEQLDQSLRDIGVPESLHQKLRAIPQSLKMDVELPPQKAGGIGWISLLAIAASLLLLMSLALMTNKDADVDGGSPTIAGHNTPDPIKYKVDVVSDINLEMERIEIALQNVDLLLIQQETKQMQRQLAELESSQSPALDPSQQQSIVLSVSCQSAIEMGASVEIFRDELEQIKLKYSGQQGSEIADRLLNPQELLN